MRYLSVCIWITSLVFSGILVPKQSVACIDPPASITVTADYDLSTNPGNILVTVHSIQLFGGPSGAFCTCAIHAYTDLFADIQYIAFVDSGTLNPIPEFQPWSADGNASAEWGLFNNDGFWDGFLAQTIGIMTTGTPVELVIRAQVAPGWTVVQIDTVLAGSRLGTDEWDATNNSLTFAHWSLLQFSSGGPPELINRNQAYFDSVDFQITGISDKELADFELFPNPVNNQLTVRFRNSRSSKGHIEIYSALGQAVLRKSFTEINQIIVLDVNDLPVGAYSVSIVSDTHRTSRKLMKL